MPRRLITVTALAAGMSIAVAISLATPALAKGPTQASITGPGLARAIVVSGGGEPGQPGPLAALAGQTGLFTALFGPAASVPVQMAAPLRTPPPKASLGPRYTVIYTVPGVTPQPGEQYGRIRQDLYPGAAGGPVIYTPPGQDGFGQPLQVTGWLRASPGLIRALDQLGVPPRPGTQATPQTRPSAAHPATAHQTTAHQTTAHQTTAHQTTAHQTGSRALAWLIAAAAAIAAVAIAAAALAGTALWRRRHKPAIVPDSEPRTSGPAAGSAEPQAGTAATSDAVVHDG
jgi:hypothetical protein